MRRRPVQDWDPADRGVSIKSSGLKKDARFNEEQSLRIRGWVVRVLGNDLVIAWRGVAFTEAARQADNGRENEESSQ